MYRAGRVVRSVEEQGKSDGRAEISISFRSVSTAEAACEGRPNAYLSVKESDPVQKICLVLRRVRAGDK